MPTVVIVEHNNNIMNPATRHVVAAARALKNPCVLLVAGFQCQKVAEEASALTGVEKVWMVDDPCYQHQLPENIAQLIAELASSAEYILCSSSTFGKDILPRVAALLDVAQLSDVSKIIDKNTFEHPVYAGNAVETVEMLDSQMVLTIRATAFSAENSQQSPCQIEMIDRPIPLQQSSWIKNELSESERPELTQAKIVVSGGRGLQNRDNFQLIEQLADVLGAAVGASRAAVDAGFVSNDYQVGQTGKIVAPHLYIAIGISGAVQHLAGMKDSKIIVAINKDEDAPIMQVANYYLVGDLFDIVPQLIEKLKVH